MLPRTLEPEVMDDRNEAIEYNEMDHSAVNALFVADLLASGPIGRDVLDLGTGTALIPVALCRNDNQIRVMASDASAEMLELARYNIEMNHLLDRIQLNQCDAKKLVFQDAYFDSVMSNSLVHHLPAAESFLAEAVRVLRPNGLLFVRDLCRPSSEEDLERLVGLYTQGETPFSQQLFRQSLHASLTVTEVQTMVNRLGIPITSVAMTSDRHWTLSYRKAALTN